MFRFWTGIFHIRWHFRQIRLIDNENSPQFQPYKVHYPWRSNCLELTSKVSSNGLFDPENKIHIFIYIIINVNTKTEEVICMSTLLLHTLYSTLCRCTNLDTHSRRPLCLSECLNWHSGRRADKAFFSISALSVCVCVCVPAYVCGLEHQHHFVCAPGLPPDLIFSWVSRAALQWTLSLLASSNFNQSSSNYVGICLRLN